MGLPLPLVALYLSFDSGGFFAGATAAAAMLLALALVLWIGLAHRPFDGIGALAGAILVLLGAFTVWVLVSGEWSGAAARAMLEFDRALLYLLAAIVAVAVPRAEGRMRTLIWGFAAAGALVCFFALASRLLPDLVTTAPNISPERLSYPLDYWNALGLLGAITGLLALWMASDVDGPAPARILGAALVPVALVTVYFTFSRGAMAAGLAGLALYLVLAHHRGLLTASLAVVPMGVVAVLVAYGADLLATENPLQEAASSQANRVALVTGLCAVGAGLARMLLIPLDRRLGRVPMARSRRRALLALAAVGVVVGIAVTAAAVDAPDWIADQYDTFVERDDIEETADTRDRLFDPGNNGRLDEWEIALDGWREDRLKGTGAGTYEILWARERPIEFAVIDGHSLYLETLAELGIVGAALLGGALLLLVAAVATRLRGRDRPLYAAVAAVLATWLLHAGVDWDWEMPAITLAPLALAAAAASRPRGEGRSTAAPGRLLRVVVLLGVLIVIVTPARVWVSQHHLDASADAFRGGDCADSIDRALDAIEALGTRPEPYELLAYCDLRLGKPDLALAALRKAVARDPDSWQLRYSTGVALAASGRDPRRALRRARRLNPREQMIEEALELFVGAARPGQLERRARRAPLPIS